MSKAGGACNHWQAIEAIEGLALPFAHDVTNNCDTTRTQSFTYDALNRLTTAQTQGTSGANCFGFQFTYDAWANLKATGILSGYTSCSMTTPYAFSLTVGSNNQITTTGFGYDASGNLSSDGLNNYVWNAESEVKTVAGFTYTYDGDGNRVEKSSGKIYWYGAGTEILDESDASGNFTNEYVFFGGKRVAMRTVSSGTIDYYEDDMLGSARTMVQASATSVCFDADFLPFAQEVDFTSTCGSNYKFEGKERDLETGNDDFGARYYRSALGRWLSADWTAVPAPVPYANLTNPQTLNLYAMVSDNPETFADLDGHTCTWGPSGSLSCKSDTPTNAPATTGEGQNTPNPQKNGTNTPNSNTQEAQKTADQTQQMASAVVGGSTVGELAKTMSNEDRSLSGGAPGELEKGKNALANVIINNALLPKPAEVAPATGTATKQDSKIMTDAFVSRLNGGADPVHGRTQYGTTHNANVQWRSAGNHLKGAAGRETVFVKFGPYKDSVSRQPTWIVIYNDPGH